MILGHKVRKALINPREVLRGFPLQNGISLGFLSFFGKVRKTGDVIELLYCYVVRGDVRAGAERGTCFEALGCIDSVYGCPHWSPFPVSLVQGVNPADSVPNLKTSPSRPTMPVLTGVWARTTRVGTKSWSKLLYLLCTRVGTGWSSWYIGGAALPWYMPTNWHSGHIMVHYCHFSLSEHA